MPHWKSTRNLHPCPYDKRHDKAWKWQNQPWIPLCDACGLEVVDVTANVDLLVCEEIKRKYGPWCSQVHQVPHWVEIENHDVGQGSHLQSEWNGVRGLLVDFATKDVHNLFEFLHSFIILEGCVYGHWTNLQDLWNGPPCDMELSPSQPTVYVIPFHKGIGIEFLNDFCMDIPHWVQQFIHVLSLNTSGMKVCSKDSNSTVLSKMIGAFL